ncbi:rhomboid family intramembrane serine protease [Candidatus Pacearchaeota archaeon]|nr:rhomboid family intramembrane serine protease [Candidatus Pacearchaeota archaeon]
MAKNRYFTFWIALILVVVFVLQLVVPGFTETFYLTSSALESPWQFVSAIFLHGGVAHLVYNLFALILFGFMLESLIGSKRFLILYLVVGIFANLVSFMFYPSSLGASGAIMALIGCMAVLKPMMTVWAFNLPMPMFVLAIIWVIGSVMGVFGLGDPTTGHIAHLSGIVIGLLYGIYLRLKKQKRERNNSIIFERKLELPEDYMQEWEKRNLRR